MDPNNNFLMFTCYCGLVSCHALSYVSMIDWAPYGRHSYTFALTTLCWMNLKSLALGLFYYVRESNIKAFFRHKYIVIFIRCLLSWCLLLIEPFSVLPDALRLTSFCLDSSIIPLLFASYCEEFFICTSEPHQTRYVGSN